MSVNNSLSNPFVIKIGKREPEENGENRPKELREEYPIDLEEIKVEGDLNTTTFDDINHGNRKNTIITKFTDVSPEEENSEKIFVVDGIIREEKPEDDLTTKKSVEMYKCKFCNKEYSKYYINEHHMTHTGEKRYKCYQCPMKFLRKSNLNKHLIIHTGIKPVQCDICLTKLCGKASLNRHMMIHTGEKPWQCWICLGKFRDKGSMLSHVVLHDADCIVKPFQCEFCSLKFRRRSTLKNHKLLHASEKPFQCHDCGIKYYTKVSLKAHFRRNHQKKES